MSDKKQYNTRSKNEKVSGDLSIQPVRPMEIKDKQTYHPNLPSINRNRGSLILLLGSQNSGKTTIINNLL